MIALIVILVYHKHKKKENNESDKNNNLNKYENTTDDEQFSTDENSYESFSNKNNKKNFKYYQQDFTDHPLNVIANSINKKRKKDKHKTKKTHEMMEINADFIEMQYHIDYNDTITGINNLTPQKELFNYGFLPVNEVKPNPDNINELVKLFMDKLNREVKYNVQEYLHVNSGWNDMGKRRREKSGFETQMEELGLPGSLYNEAATKAPLRLIKIDKAEQFNTTDQIRFVAYIIAQKVNVKDQIVLKVQFFMEREDLSKNRDDREKFFSKDINDNDIDLKIDPDQVVIIEQVFILGYLTNETKLKTKMDKFHEYNDVRRMDGTIDQEKVIKMMLKKHKERENELNSFMCTLDEDTKEIHDVPNVDYYSVYKNTRTIMDDLAKYPQDSFGDIRI
jgi:hypothetical protein